MKKFLLCFIIFFSFSMLCYAEKYEVSLAACVDGDTARFILDGNEIKTRFLGIDTPETVHPSVDEEKKGKNASDYTCSTLQNSNLIEIEYDPGSDKTDKYGRYLVWVFVDGELLQSKLLKIGYAEVKYIYGNYLYTNLLYENQAIAQEKKLGIWSEEENVSNEIILNINGMETSISKNNIILIGILLLISITLTLKKCKIRVKLRNK